MKLKKVVDSKPKLKSVKKKPVLKPKRKLKIPYNVLNTDVIAEAFTGEYRGNFPWKPEMIDYAVIQDEESLAWLAETMMTIPEFAYDTETNTLDVLGPNRNFKCVGISISWGEKYNYYIPLGHIREEDIDTQLDLDVVVEYMKPVFEREDVRIIGHNLKFDMHVLQRIGITIKTKDLFDTMLASWLCNENTPNGLKENSLEKMGLSQTHFAEATTTVPNEVKKQFGYKANARVTFDLVLIKDGAPYALADAFYTYCLYLGFTQELVDEEMDKIYYKMYIPFLQTLFKMEEQGVSVNVDRLKEMGVDMQKDLDDLTYKIYELAGVEFNIGSSQQKAEILFGWEKPDTPVKRDKIPAQVQKIVEKYKSGELDLSEVQEQLNKKGFYFDEKGNVFKSSNKNTAILSKSFGFRCTSQTATGNPSTDSDTIWRISQMNFKTNKRKQQGVEMCKLMLEYSKLSKLKTAFVDGILEKLYEDGKAHPSFNQIGTDSGRLSCSNPNLQQLPKANEDDKYQIRSVFIGSIDPETGKRKKIIALDYHNLEMVCLTYFSHDKNLSEMFANDDDAHGSTAVNMFNLDCTPTEAKKKYPHLRQAAKTINFLLMYGGGASLLYENLKTDHYSPLDLGAKEYLEMYHCKNGVEVAQQFIDKYFESYSGVAKFISGQKKYAHRNHCVYTILGRKRRLPDINSHDRKVSSYCERLAVNSAIQGTAGDITINAQIRVDAVDRLKEMGCNMLIQVHDELVFECPEQYCEEAISIIKHIMEHPFGDSENRQVPYLRADYDVGNSYQDAK